jgi:hypothetical protein
MYHTKPPELELHNSLQCLYAHEIGFLFGILLVMKLSGEIIPSDDCIEKPDTGMSKSNYSEDSWYW